MKVLRHELRLLLLAVQFLTRVPVPAWVGFEPHWLSQCLRHFPLVGALVGLGTALVTAAAMACWPPAVAVVLGMAFSVWLTGGFHEDGWADTCDGLGGSVGRDKALLIMKDSRLGSYGALGLTLLLMLKAAVLTSLATPLIHELGSAQTSHVHEVLLAWTMMAIVWCHAASRLVPVWLTRCLPYAGDAEHAKAKPLALQTGIGNALAATVALGVVAALMWLWLDHAGWPTPTLVRALWWSVAAMAVCGLVCGRWFQRRLGGFTGDTLGASQQLAEVAGLLAWLAVVHPVTRWA